MLKKWKVIVPLAVGAAGALAAGVATLLKKLPQPEKAAPAPAPARTADWKTGSYSFVSGFRDAATVEVLLDYDPEQFGFEVVSEDFLSYSSDSHVAILRGVEFNLQLEYAGYYSGEDFAAHAAALREKYRTNGSIRLGEYDGVWVLDGDNVAVSLPVDGSSYLLITIQKTKEYDDEVTTLVQYPPLLAILDTLRIGKG